MKRLINKHTGLIASFIGGFIISFLIIRKVSIATVTTINLPWHIFQIRNDFIGGQDISGDHLGWFDGTAVELFDLATGEITSFDNFMACSIPRTK